MSENTVMLIITVIATGLLLIACGRTLGVINPNCDPAASDKFNQILELYEGCANDDSKCGGFTFVDIPVNHEIIFRGEGGSSSIELLCNEKRGKIKFFDDVGLCKYTEINDEYVGTLENIEIDNSGDYAYSKNGRYELKKFGGSDVCFVMPIPELPPIVTY